MTFTPLPTVKEQLSTLDFVFNDSMYGFPPSPTTLTPQYIATFSKCRLIRLAAGDYGALQEQLCAMAGCLRENMVWFIIMKDTLSRLEILSPDVRIRVGDLRAVAATLVELHGLLRAQEVLVNTRLFRQLGFSISQLSARDAVDDASRD